MKQKQNLNESQLTLPFGHGRTAAISLDDRARILWFMGAVSLLSLFVYFYAVNVIARNTALRQNLEAHVADASGRIGALEFSYIELKNSITSEVAASHGFKEVRAPLYVSRTGSTALTLNR
jgi:hypothetical protein